MEVLGNNLFTLSVEWLLFFPLTNIDFKGVFSPVLVAVVETFVLGN